MLRKHPWLKTQIGNILKPS